MMRKNTYELEDLLKEASKMEHKEEKKIYCNKWNRISKNCGTNTNALHTHNEKTRRRKGERKRREIWSNNDGEFPQINIRHQTIDRGVSDNTRKDPYQKKICTKACHIETAEIKDVKQSWRRPRKNSSSMKEKREGLYLTSIQKSCKQG